MRVGSLVECVNNEGIQFAIKPELNKIYTVRRVRTVSEKKLLGVNSKEDGILLEEIVNPIVAFNEEAGYKTWRFREVQPPIGNIEELINENTLEPELV